MAFMEPDYYHGTMVICGRSEHDTDIVPEEHYEEAHHGPKYGTDTGWFYRLSASGYMDWSGPYATEAEARDACRDDYDCDPDTWDDLPEDA